MKGFIPRTALGLCLCTGVSLFTGCTAYREIVDPCWLQPYGGMARQSVRDMHNAQADKGHLLDQTIWNWMFEADAKTGSPTDRLNGAGIEHLKYISRRFPQPDCQLFLQTAQDIPYSEGGPDKVVDARNELNMRREQAIRNFLSTQTFTHHAHYQISIHDFAPPYLESTPIVGTRVPPLPITGAYPKLQDNFQGRAPVVPGFGSGPGAVQQ